MYSGPEGQAIFVLENGGWFSRRAIHLLILSGVFARHPGLKLVLTEQPGNWWPYVEKELETVYLAQTRQGGPLKDLVPERPSEYLHRNVFVGASFLSPSEAHDAVAEGYADRIMWGADYPHMEGTFQMGETSFTRLSLRFALAHCDEATIRAMAGETAASVYGLNLPELEKLAVEIGAPTVSDIREPVGAIPPGGSPFAFRTLGPWS
jgi:predicted TIM-barrel fold metal-dependent hydrolase